MELLFLGTGAADWEKLDEDKMLDGMRRYSSMLINGEILVDLAPQSIGYAEHLGLDLGKIKYLFISHTHSDHYSKAALYALLSHIDGKLTILCHEDAVAALGLSDDVAEKIEIIPLTCLKPVSLQGFDVMPLRSNHLVENSPEQCLHYIFDIGGKKLFYGCDGAWFCADTWEHMRTLKFDAMIFDATVGDYDGDYRLGTHNSIPMLRMIATALKENNMLNPDAVLIADHLAKTLHAPEKKTRKMFKKFGMLTAFDGLKINI